MTKVIYEIVEHDGGWAYRMGDTYSETYPSREGAQGAAYRAVKEQRLPGEVTGISWEDAGGSWHDEVSSGDDRPEAEVAG